MLALARPSARPCAVQPTKDKMKSSHLLRRGPQKRIRCADTDRMKSPSFEKQTNVADNKNLGITSAVRSAILLF